MSIWDLFGKNKKQPDATNRDNTVSKKDTYKEIFSELAKESPSKHFASGTIFDITRMNHDVIEKCVRMNYPKGIYKLFTQSYQTYLSNPAAFGAIPQVVDGSRNDTDPTKWNIDIIQMANNDRAVLCFMPIRDEKLSARIVGIAVSDHGDAYYYCMLNKDETVESEVIRNKAMNGVERVGSVKGLGFKLMQDFIDCMKKDFYHQDGSGATGNTKEESASDKQFSVQQSRTQSEITDESDLQFYLIPCVLNDEKGFSKPDYGLHFTEYDTPLLKQPWRRMWNDLPDYFYPCNGTDTNTIHYAKIIHPVSHKQLIPLFTSYRIMTMMFGNNYRVAALSLKNAKQLCLMDNAEGIIIEPGPRGKVISFEEIKREKQLEESVLNTVQAMDEAETAKPWRMKRAIEWCSHCWDDIELVYDRGENDPAIGKDLMELEQTALREAKDNCGLININNKYLTVDDYLKMSEFDKEKVMYLMGSHGLKELTLSYQDPIITVTFAPLIPRIVACTIFNLLNRLEKLDGSYSRAFCSNQKAKLVFKLPLGGRKGMMKYEMMIVKIYPWIGQIEETFTDQMAILP